MTAEDMVKEAKSEVPKKEIKRNRDSWKHFRHHDIELFKLGNTPETPKPCYSEKQKEQETLQNSQNSTFIDVDKSVTKKKAGRKGMPRKNTSNNLENKNNLEDDSEKLLEKEQKEKDTLNNADSNNLKNTNPHNLKVIFKQNKESNEYQIVSSKNGDENNSLNNINDSNSVTSNSQQVGRHYLPIRVTEKRKSIAEPLSKNLIQTPKKPETVSSNFVDTGRYMITNLLDENNSQVTHETNSLAILEKNLNDRMNLSNTIFPKENTNNEILEHQNDTVLKTLSEKNHLEITPIVNNVSGARKRKAPTVAEEKNSTSSKISKPKRQYQRRNPKKNQVQNPPEISESPPKFQTPSKSQEQLNISLPQNQIENIYRSALPPPFIPQGGNFRYIAPAQPPPPPPPKLYPPPVNMPPRLNFNTTMPQFSQENRQIPNNFIQQSHLENSAREPHFPNIYPPGVHQPNNLRQQGNYLNYNQLTLPKNNFENYRNEIENRKPPINQLRNYLHNKDINNLNVTQNNVDSSLFQENFLQKSLPQNNRINYPSAAQNISSNMLRTFGYHFPNIPSQNIPSQNIPSQNILSQNILSQNILSQNIPSQNKPNFTNYFDLTSENKGEFSQMHNRSNVSVPFEKHLPLEPVNAHPVGLSENTFLRHKQRGADTHLTYGILTPPGSSIDSSEISEINNKRIALMSPDRPKIPPPNFPTPEEEKMFLTMPSIKNNTFSDSPNLILNLSRNSVIKSNFRSPNREQECTKAVVSSSEKNVNDGNNSLPTGTQTLNAIENNKEVKEMSTQTDLIPNEAISEDQETKTDENVIEEREITGEEKLSLNSVFTMPKIIKVTGSYSERYENITPDNISEETNDNKNNDQVILITDDEEKDDEVTSSQMKNDNVILIDDSSDEDVNEENDCVIITEENSSKQNVPVQSKIEVNKISSVDSFDKAAFAKFLPPLHQNSTLKPDEYVKEIKTLEENGTPPEFYDFYMFITKRQILINQEPISFKIFLEFQNAGRLKDIEEIYNIYISKCDKEKH